MESFVYSCMSYRKMAKDEIDGELPAQDKAKEFYAKYEPKEVLGRYVRLSVSTFYSNTLIIYSGASLIQTHVWKLTEYLH